MPLCIFSSFIRIIQHSSDISRYLVQRKGFRCTFLSQHAPGVDGGVERIQYLIQGGATPQTHAPFPDVLPTAPPAY